MRKNKKGFGVVEILLVIVVIGLIVAVGWLFFDRQKSKNNETTTISKVADTGTEQKAQQPGESDPAATWQSYKSPDGKFSLKYPQSWITAANPEYCSEGLLLLGVKMSDGQSSVGKCASDGARASGQIAISWSTDSTYASLCKLDSSSWQIDSTESVTISGVTAKKTSATYIADDEDVGGEAKGNKTVQYCLTSNDTTYIASYTKWAEFPDVLDDFNTLVTKTFTLN